MHRKRLYLIAAPLLAAVTVCAAASPSEAGVRHQTRTVQGPRGHGFTATRDLRSGGGQISNQVTRTFQDGAVSSRSGSVTRGPGAVSWDRSHTGSGGRTQSGWGTIYRTDDGYTRSRG